MISLIQSKNICSAVEKTLELTTVGDFAPTFIVVPDRFTLQAEMILLRYKSSLLNVRVVTFSMLFNILREELGAEAQVLDKSSAVLFMWEATQSVKDKLVWFNRSVGHFAFAEKMFNTINQLSSSMVDFDSLVSNSRSEITRKKMHDIALIRDAYKKLIAEYTDSSGVLGWLIENIKNSKIIKQAKVFITGFGHLSIQRGAVVSELVRHAGEFTAGFRKGSEFEEMIAELVMSTKCKYIEVDERKIGKGELRNFDTLQDEAVWVANEICRLVRVEGVRFRDIVVVAADYEASAKVFAEVFTGEGIAVNVDVGADLLLSPLAQFLREHLLLAASGGQVHFLNIIKSVYSGLCKEEEFELENSALKTGMRGNEVTTPIVRKLAKCKTAKEFCEVLVEILPESDDLAHGKLLELFEVITRISAEQKISISEFINVFTTLASATKVSDIPHLSDAVLLVSVAEYQPSFAPYVFVTGAVDGAFPVAQDDTDIITAQDIANTAVRIEPSATLQNARNRRHAVDIMTSATKKLYISYTGINRSELAEGMQLAMGDTEIASKTFAMHMVLRAIGDGTAFLDMDYYGNVLESLGLGDMEYINLGQSMADLKVAERLFFPKGTAQVTQLESFRECPYSHFLKFGLYVKARERNKLAANIVGTVIHKIAEEFTKKIISVGSDGLAKFNAEVEMKMTVEEVLGSDKFNFLTTDARNTPVISNLKKEAKQLATEIIKQLDGWEYFPAFTEMPLQGDIEGVIVRGKADRVDVNESEHAVIIDYKTGATIDKKSLQLPLYIRFLPEKYTADGAFYHSLRPGKFSVVKAELPDAAGIAREIISQIKKGVIAPNPTSKQVCRYCVARNTCQGGGDGED
jgi:ATP-dependent helicase/nuclease subunit B